MKFNTKLTLKIYWQHVQKYRFVGFVMLISLITAPAINAIIPLYFKKLFDILSIQAPSQETVAPLLSIIWVIFIFEAVQWMIWRIAVACAIYFQSGISTNITNTCFEYLHKHSFTYFNNNFVGSLVKKVNRFSQSFINITDRISWNLLPLFVNIVVILYVLILQNRLLGGIVGIWIVVFLSLNYGFTLYKLKFDVRRAAADTQVTKVLADTITNHVNVKLFNGYVREISLFKDTTKKLQVLRRLTWNLDHIFEAVQGILMIGLEIGAFYIAVILWSEGKFSIGDFVLLQSYFIIIFMRVWDFGRMIRHLYEDFADAEEMTEVFKTPHEIVNTPSAKDLQVTHGKISFNKVNFAYNQTRKVIHGLNLVIKSHEKVALVGPSGAGKSTVVKLLLRQHDVTQGNILIDDQKITKVTLESLWRSISFVPQDPILFHRTLMENIRYGKPDATDNDVVKASKLAHCHEFISNFPDKYETFVGERGVKLSGGERQRVAIARAILRNAPILLLDEATSSLDSQSELLIQDALDTLMRGKTVIVIAHRLSTIMRMDRIVVIDNGKIIEEGTHAELLENKRGLYKKLWTLQAGGFIE